MGALNKVRYQATGSFTPAATPTDLITIAGSATKLVTVESLQVGTTNTAAGSQEFALIKRSALDTTGTFVAASAAALDSLSPGGAAAPAPSATVGHYTANPGGLGTALGTINRVRVGSPAAVPGSFAGVRLNASEELMDKPVALRGVAENLAVNFAGAALVSGQTHVYKITWTEE